jgi:hypothetical protein
MRESERRCAVHGDSKIVDIAVPPILSRLVRLDDWVVTGVEVSGRVPVWGLVAAPDVAA